MAYRWDGPFDTTEAGALLGHVTLGMLMLDRRLALEAAPPRTRLERLLLQHLIASHHARQEFGAAVAPTAIGAAERRRPGGKTERPPSRG